MKRHTILIMVTILIAALASCSYENTATVTIDTGIRQQAQLSWFDRLIAYLSFSQPLQADPVPGNVYFDVLELSITASDMSTITSRYTIEELINSYGKITVEVPSGSQRVFTIVAGNSEGAEIYNKIYGGITTVDLSPGQEVNLNIEMGELPVIDNPFYDTYNNININTNKDYNILSFNIYRTVNGVLKGPIVIKNFTENCSGECNYNFNYFLGSQYEDYCDSNSVYISGVNKYGEGERMVLSNCM